MTEHDAALFRLAFHEAAEEIAQWSQAPMHKGDKDRPPDKQYALWVRLYERVRDSEAGLAVLQHVQALQDRIDSLELQIDSLRSRLRNHEPQQPQVTL